ncbi:transglycosylase SLT domain-containing protein [Acinetobacter baumannii]|uniref:transglycosylase SLT domain-containing protein n=1 Tax=Acinetobacter baumannii TaxID=470 RepID=UPI00189BF652|nr:transglycosylase SLT domain-containing protein [Acinetobacter baumannii]MBF6745481.1 transglycosylase SLT domain-containing protein [Acinetobacter baumannii]MBF6831560.1 transglycosylase SLT domain-containing protein [Acinetobacter baumannii]MBF6839102.1 transglycosylase SLT domain-containing protein [Acinetobacter baumannii]MBF6919846.1 transglycosylase SLT domain-containing protein [Acinetobacter baumannii]MBF6929430.1 transglycosylase SLT domain-containing protein [Acinetobacter baumanni
MATNLGTLTLNLLANTGSYIQGLSRAERQTRNSTRGMADGFDLVGKSLTVLKGVVAGLSVASVTSFALEVIRTGNEVDKLAKLSNSSVSQFQYYSKGALTAGISIEKFADQMKDMQDRIGDFQQTGGGPLADFFENIAPLVGVTIQQFQKLSGPEALQLFYNSLEKVGATKNDIKFYMEQIISDSSQLIPLLENNGKLFKEWGDRAKETGAVMSDDMVGSLVEAQKNLQIFEMQWEGLKNGLVADVIPVLQMVVQNTDTIKAVAVAAAAAIGTKLVVQGTILAGTFTMAAIRAGVMEATLISMQGAAATTATSMGILRGAVAFLGGPAGLAMLAVQAVVAGSAYYAMKSATEDSTKSLDNQGESIDDLIIKYDSLSVAKQKAFLFDEQQKLITSTEEYEQAKNQVAAYASGIANVAKVSSQSAHLIEEWRKQYLAGEMTATELSNLIGSLSDIQGAYNSHMVEYASVADKANTKLGNQKSLVDSLSDANRKVTKTQEDQNRSLDNAVSRYQLLTKAQRDYITQAKQDVLREGYIKTLVREGVSVEKANLFADAQVAANKENAFKAPLPKDVLLAARENFNLKNYDFKPSELAAIAKVQGIAKANNFAQIESLYGLPAGTLAALVLQESRGNAKAISPTGAKGLFQTTGIFREQYGLTSKSSIEEQAVAAARDLQKNYQKFGDRAKALMAYNAGAGGLNSYLKGGLSSDKRKEVAGYVPGFQKWFAGVNGKTTVDNSILMPTQEDLLGLIDSAAEAQKALDDARKDYESGYFTEPQKLLQDHKDRLDKAHELYGGTPQLKEMIDKENALYAAQSAKLIADEQNKYNQYFAFETDRIKQIERDYENQKQLVLADVELNKTKKAEITAALDRQKEQEIAWEKLEQQQRLSDASAFLRTEIENIQVRYAFEREQILLNSQLAKDEQQQRIALSKAQEQLGLLDQATQASGAWDATYADMNGTGQQYQLEQQRNGRASQSLKLAGAQDALAQTAAEREAIWQAHTERMFMIDQQYELDKASLGTKAAADTLSGMTDLMGSLLGEQSAGYKAMFAMSKAFAIAQAIINAPKTFSDVYASVAAIPYVGPYLAPAMAGAAVAVQLAQVAQIKSTNLTGMAHDGIDYVPQEGTWLLNKGERVLSPRQNQDFTRAMAEKRFDSQLNITINNHTNSKVTARQDSNGGVTIDVVDERIARSWENLNRANSDESRAVMDNFNVGRNRGG